MPLALSLIWEVNHKHFLNENMLILECSNSHQRVNIGVGSGLAELRVPAGARNKKNIPAMFVLVNGEDSVVSCKINCSSVDYMI